MLTAKRMRTRHDHVRPIFEKCGSNDSYRTL